MPNINEENYRITKNICSYCYPNQSTDFLKTVSYLFDSSNNWVGGYTTDKYAKYQEAYKEYAKDKKSICFSLDEDHGVYICKKHLLEFVDKMDSYNG